MGQLGQCPEGAGAARREHYPDQGGRAQPLGRRFYRIAEVGRGAAAKRSACQRSGCAGRHGGCPRYHPARDGERLQRGLERKPTRHCHAADAALPEQPGSGDQTERPGPQGVCRPVEEDAGAGEAGGTGSTGKGLYRPGKICPGAESGQGCGGQCPERNGGSRKQDRPGGHPGGRQGRPCQRICRKAAGQRERGHPAGERPGSEAGAEGPGCPGDGQHPAERAEADERADPDDREAQREELCAGVSGGQGAAGGGAGQRRHRQPRGGEETAGRGERHLQPAAGGHEHPGRDGRPEERHHPGNEDGREGGAGMGEQQADRRHRRLADRREREPAAENGRAAGADRTGGQVAAGGHPGEAGLAQAAERGPAGLPGRCDGVPEHGGAAGAAGDHGADHVHREERGRDAGQHRRRDDRRLRRGAAR